MGVEVLVIGPADDAGLAMGAPSTVGQEELGKMNMNRSYKNNNHLVQIKYLLILEYHTANGTPPFSQLQLAISIHRVARSDLSVHK